MAASAFEIELPELMTSDWFEKNHSTLIKKLRAGNVIINCGKLKQINSLTSAFIKELSQLSEESKNELLLVAVPQEAKKSLQNLSKSQKAPQSAPAKPNHFTNVGTAALELYQGVLYVIHLFAEFVYWSSVGVFKKKTILKGSTLGQMVSLGSSALGIVLLLSFLIGLTLAIQSAVQLEQFGASIYLASGIGISMVTEIGPMMTAVIIAGRSGSAITAEISTMVVQEELKALKSMAINPIHFILLPRIWAMTLTLPLLTIGSALIGIFAGFLVSFFYLDIPTDLFLAELGSAVTVTMIWQSLIKVLCFAWIICLIAIYKGLNVRGGADAVGKATTSCVVACIFCIIMADAVFSFIYYF